MMKEILFAIIQGLTEFFPISSSGHLALFGNFFSNIDISLFVYLHLASLFAVLIFFREKIKFIFFRERRYFLYVLLGIIPAGFFGLFFRDFIDKAFSSLFFIGICFFITSIFLFLTKFKFKEKKLNVKNSLLIGLLQILALFPGISRSGITISSARILGLKKDEAFNFSFLMFIPLVIGASFLELFNKSKFFFSFNYLIPFFVCFLTSYFSLVLLNKFLKEGKFWFFGFYCLILGIICIFFYLS